MSLHPFAQAYYEVLRRVNNIEDVELSCEEVVKYLNQLEKTLMLLGTTKELINYLLYSLAALADHFILNTLNEKKETSSNRVISCSIEVTLFKSAEAGQKLANNAEEILSMRLDENIKNLLKIYLNVLSWMNKENTSLLERIKQSVYSVKLDGKDPFGCQKRPTLNKSMKYFIYQKWLLLSLSSVYGLLSTFSWNYAVTDLRSSVYRLNELSYMD